MLFIIERKKYQAPLGENSKLGLSPMTFEVWFPLKGIKCIDKGSKIRKKARKIILNSGWKVNIGGASLNMEQTSGHMVDKQVHSAAEEQLVVMLSLMP